MDLTGIIAISGRPGLYKVIAQGKNNISIVAVNPNGQPIPFMETINGKRLCLHQLWLQEISKDHPSLVG
ncbi:MAG: hypothetical protein RJB31_1726 [Bacteroidota bacterium]